jgi:hypothetical protein
VIRWLTFEPPDELKDEYSREYSAEWRWIVEGGIAPADARKIAREETWGKYFQPFLTASLITGQKIELVPFGKDSQMYIEAAIKGAVDSDPDTWHGLDPDASILYYPYEGYHIFLDPKWEEEYCPPSPPQWWQGRDLPEEDVLALLAVPAMLYGLAVAFAALVSEMPHSWLP